MAFGCWTKDPFSTSDDIKDREVPNSNPSQHGIKNKYMQTP
jgi:hypothetical protein